ncbi:caldesmon, putative [Entamoeba invadens IP1]|uniref:Caldesmon, putative n=1 Tax=Entamoeba invadens IP1 TaxID=370355 RepID=A0A0A1U4T5_ENTIV|nr:caldesmon, putative [Entamoeba invadens IP1]ELP89277.1 caldesmon, putative [Entamoeba invadens IP1]|eukprot:XP_004256048.1 caldesmon, putative [Entamoeba invadens IP1]
MKFTIIQDYEIEESLIKYIKKPTNNELIIPLMFGKKDKNKKKMVIEKRGPVERSHIGFSSTGELEVENLPSAWVAFFKKAGVKKSDLADKETRDKVFKLMASSSVVNDMQKEVSNNPNAAKALRNTMKPQKKIPEGMTVTPITPQFIKQQQDKEVSRTIRTSTTPGVAPTPIKETKIETKQQPSVHKKPVAPYHKFNSKTVTKQHTTNHTAQRGKVNIPSAFAEGDKKDSYKPKTFYEKVEEKEKEKPKTSNVNNSSSVVKPTQNKKLLPQAETKTAPVYQRQSAISQNPAFSKFNTQQTTTTTQPKRVVKEDSDDDEMFKPTVIGNEWSDDEEQKCVIPKPAKSYKTSQKSPDIKKEVKPKVLETPKEVQKPVEEKKEKSVSTQQKTQASQKSVHEKKQEAFNKFNTPTPSNSSQLKPKTYTYQTKTPLKKENTVTPPQSTTGFKKPSPPSSQKTPPQTTVKTTCETVTPPQTKSPSFKRPSPPPPKQDQIKINEDKAKEEKLKLEKEKLEKEQQEKREKQEKEKQQREKEEKLKAEKEKADKEKEEKLRADKLKEQKQKEEKARADKEREKIEKEKALKAQKEQEEQQKAQKLLEQAEQKEREERDKNTQQKTAAALAPPSSLPPPNAPPPVIKSGVENANAGISFTQLIFAQSGNLNKTEMKEKQVQEDEVVLALRGILDERRKDIATEYSDDEDDWSDDDW